MPLILVDEETCQWIDIPSRQQVFFLGGVEADTVPYFDLRGWHTYDVNVHLVGSDWWYRDRLLHDGDILEEPGTSRLFVLRVPADQGPASALVCEPDAAVAACQSLCDALEAVRWPGDTATLARLTSTLAAGDTDGSLRRRLRERCERTVRAAREPVPTALAVSFLSRLADHDPLSVDVLATLFGDRAIHPAAFGSIAATAPSAAKVVLTRLKETGASAADTIQSSMAAWLIQHVGKSGEFKGIG